MLISTSLPFYNQIGNDIKGKNLYILKKGNTDIDLWNVVWCLNDVDGTSDECLLYSTTFWIFFLDMSFTCHIIYKWTFCDKVFSRNVASGDNVSLYIQSGKFYFYVFYDITTSIAKFFVWSTDTAVCFPITLAFYFILRVLVSTICCSNCCVRTHFAVCSSLVGILNINFSSWKFQIHRGMFTNCF